MTTGIELHTNRALHDLPRSGVDRLLDARQEAKVVAMICSKPPEGFARWTISLIVREVISRGISDTVSDETIRRLLHRHELKPWERREIGVRG
ncbi:helix-turn-helix domain-containing protein [Oligoflexus sp.]|uniref:helix-turn-helix domain-containing protein n=1 Tax=Oligoflexus sp. TaxID=1971216 RepID=UPI0039C99D1A